MAKNTGSRTERTTKQQKKNMLEALNKTVGIVSHAAKLCGISRNLHYLWLQNDPEYAQAVTEVDITEFDVLKSALFKKVQEGDTSAIIFGIKCRGKKYGWAEKSEVDLSGTIEIAVKDPYEDQG